MALPQGINFRSTSGYVTDGANEQVETSSGNTSAGAAGVSYPYVSTQGNNVGWETLSSPTPSTRDRNSGIDVRLAGKHDVQANDVATYRIDLPTSGSKNIRLAAGDYGGYGSDTNVELFDTNTSLGVLASTATTASQRFRDATDTEYTAANWPGSNTAVAKTFSTTILRFKVGTVSAAGAIAHFYVENAGGGATDTPVNPGAGTLTITGYAPTVAQTANQSVDPGAGTLTITGYAPTVVQDTRVNPSVGAMVFTGFAPTVAQTANQFITPGVGLMSVTGFAPVVTQTGVTPHVTVDWLTRARRRGIR